MSTSRIATATIAVVALAAGLVAPAAHAGTTTAPGSGVLIGLVGTSGIQADIPQLQGHVVSGYSPTGDTGLTDATSHDTGVASVMVGIAPGATIMPAVRDWCAGLDYVVQAGATVVAIPQLTYQDIPCLRDAVARAVAKDVVVVAGVGNDGTERTRPIYPADYPTVIGAGAVDANNHRPAWATVGPSVDLVAPGDNVTVANPSGGTNLASGTSYSTGHIAAVAAVVRGAHPDWTAARVLTALSTTATDLGAPGRDWWYGDGLVSLAAAQ